MQEGGSTDLLINYTFRQRVHGTTQQLGLASAIAMFIFVIVGTVSAYGFRLTRRLEEIGTMTVVTEPVATPPKHSKGGELKADRMPFGRWFRLVGWRHLIAVVMVRLGAVPRVLRDQPVVLGEQDVDRRLLAGPQGCPGSHLPGPDQVRLRNFTRPCSPATSTRS